MTLDILKTTTLYCITPVWRANVYVYFYGHGCPFVSVRWRHPSRQVEYCRLSVALTDGGIYHLPLTDIAVLSLYLPVSAFWCISLSSCLQCVRPSVLSACVAWLPGWSCCPRSHPACMFLNGASWQLCD